MKKTIAAIAILAVVGFSAASFAADAPADATPTTKAAKVSKAHKHMAAKSTEASHARAAAQQPVSGWSGLTLGIDVGAQLQRSRWKTTSYTSPPGGPIPFGSNPESLFSSATARLGPVFGYRRQVSDFWVLGLETDFHLQDNSAKKSTIPGAGDTAFPPTGPLQTEVKALWDASLRAKAGYLFQPDLMAYLTGGPSLQRLEDTASCFADTNFCNPANGTEQSSKTRNRIGWTAGAGLEKMIANNTFAHVEYRYAAYGKDSRTVFAPNPTETFGLANEVRTHTHALTIGFSKQF